MHRSLSNDDLSGDLNGTKRETCVRRRCHGQSFDDYQLRSVDCIQLLIVNEVTGSQHNFCVLLVPAGRLRWTYQALQVIFNFCLLSVWRIYAISFCKLSSRLNIKQKQVFLSFHYNAF